MVKLIFNSNDDKGFDNTDNAWKYYKKKYKIVNDTALDIQGQIIEVSGECVFNFGTRYQKLKKIINSNKDFENSKRTVLLQTLDICHELHHSLPNIMVLPKWGGLNTLKGEIYYSSKNSEWRVRKGKYVPNEWFDRPDTLVYYINEYYIKKQHWGEMEFKDIGKYFSNGIFTSSIIHGESFAQLLEILDEIDGVEAFCSLFYQIDKEMITEWLEKRVNCLVIDDIEGYLNQALKFWSFQMKNIFKMLLNEDVCIYLKGESVKGYVEQQLEGSKYNNQLVIEESEGDYQYKLKKIKNR